MVSHHAGDHDPAPRPRTWRQTEVDGIPVLLAPAAGPMTAGLVFRVGIADEPLAWHGITHMVEHLALFRSNLTDYHSNGSTGPIVTDFVVQGSESDVASFLSGVCDSLCALPVERLETEKAILRTEQSGRQIGANHDLPMWRYGARSYGVSGYPEWGVPRLRAEDVQHWARTCFTRQNAVLWIAGDQVPAGLRLRLPDGRRRPVPEPTSALPATPAFFAGGRGNVVMDAVVRRGTAAMAFSSVLERVLFRDLRQEGGYSYTVTTAYEPRGDDFATITALADALPEKLDAVLGGFVDVLAALRVGRIDQQDLDAVLSRAEAALGHPDAEASRLPGQATNLLIGRPVQSLDELRAELKAISLDDLRRVAVEAARTALWQVPPGRGAEWAGFTAAPAHSASAVTGVRHQVRAGTGPDLVIGPDGVTMVDGDTPHTVRFRECAVMLAWPDGGRRLIGHDAITVEVEPTHYALPPQALAAIDAQIDPNAVVWLPARSPDQIPSAAAGHRRGVEHRPEARTGRSRGRIAVAAVFGTLTVLWALLMLVGALGMAEDPATRPGDWAGLAFLAAFCIPLALPVVLVWRKLRRRPGR